VLGREDEGPTLAIRRGPAIVGVGVDVGVGVGDWVQVAL